MKDIARSLDNYSQALGSDYPFQCGNLLVASQYALPLHILGKYLKPTSTLLDWGCGAGHFSYLLMQENYDVHSYAYSPEKLSAVKKKARLNLRKKWRVFPADDPILLPFKENAYDGVISLGVLEHVRESGGNELASLSEIYRILKPGGIFCCFHFPNRTSWIEAASRTLNKFNIPKYYHPFLYNKEDILKLVSSTPFLLQEIGLYNLFPRSSLRRLPQMMATPSTLSAYTTVEKLASLLLRHFSQNFYFVLQKPRFSLEKRV